MSATAGPNVSATLEAFEKLERGQKADFSRYLKTQLIKRYAIGDNEEENEKVVPPKAADIAWVDKLDIFSAAADTAVKDTVLWQVLTNLTPSEKADKVTQAVQKFHKSRPNLLTWCQHELIDSS